MSTQSLAPTAPVVRLRIATAALSVVVVASFIAVGASAAIVVSALAAVIITWRVWSGGAIATVFAGLFGLLIFVLAAMMLLGDGPGGFGDVLFCYGGGILGAVVVVLAGSALLNRSRS